MLPITIQTVLFSCEARSSYDRPLMFKNLREARGVYCAHICGRARARRALVRVMRRTSTILLAGAPEGCRFAAAGPNNVRQRFLIIFILESFKSLLSSKSAGTKRAYKTCQTLFGRLARRALGLVCQTTKTRMCHARGSKFGQDTYLAYRWAHTVQEKFSLIS